MSFGRVVSLAVQTITEPVIPFVISTVEPEGVEAINLTGLRIRFNILKTSAETPNAADIEIFNISQETVNKIAVVGNKIVLKAGYEDEGGAKTVFIGSISNAYYTHEGTETKLEILSIDGYSAFGTKPISLSYSAGTSPSTVVTDVLSSISLPIAYKTSIVGASYTQGYSFAGSAFDCLEEVLSRAGLYYTIQNGFIYILGEETIESTAFLISSETGLLESPVPIKTTDSSGSIAVGSAQYRVTCLLNANLLPGSYVKIESRSVNGEFKIQVIRQKGDSWKGDFESEMEVIEL